MAWCKWGLACCLLLEVAFADEWVRVHVTSPFAVYGVVWNPDSIRTIRVSQSDTTFIMWADSQLCQVWYGYVELPEDRDLQDLTSFGIADSFTWIYRATPIAMAGFTVNPLNGPLWNDSVAALIFESNFWRVRAAPTSGQGTFWYELAGPEADSFAVDVRQDIPWCRWFAMGASAWGNGDTLLVHPEDYVVNWRFHTNDVAIESKAPDRQLEIYPNPANGWFVLSGLFNEIEDVTIYDLLGRKVFERDLNKSITHIEAPWPTGIYFVQVGDQPPLRLHTVR